MKHRHMDALLIVSIVFLVVGLSFLGVSGVTGIITGYFYENAVPVDGEIVEVDRWSDDWDVYVRYTYEGREYFEELDVYSITMREGDSIELMIDPRDPDDPLPKGMENILSVIFLAVGGSLTLAGGIILIIRMRRRRKRRLLLDMGRRVEATITNAYANTFVRVNGRHPWKVECTDGSGRRYTSDNVYSRCDGLVGQKVTVYVHPFDDEKYYVDVEGERNP